MSKNSHITAAVILTTLVLTGCAGSETPNATNTSNPQPTPSLQATAQQPAQPKSSTQPFDNPIVSSTLPVSPGSVASLIQPTNGTERLVVVQKGRTDPFGQIVEPIGFNPPQVPGDKIAVPKLRPLPTATLPKPISKTATKPATLLPKKPLQIAQKPIIRTVLPRVLPGSVLSPQLKNILPPAPQPETARAVIVSGVILIGKVPQAIVKVPDEPTSRYVKPGQRLVNGVLVKRIEMSQGSNPTVILEQYGIEVAKQVGEQPAQESKPSTTASIINGLSVMKPQKNFVGADS